MIRRAHATSPALLGARLPWCWLLSVAATVVVARGAHAQPAASATPPSAPAAGAQIGSEIADELARLEGQRVRVLDQRTPDDRGYVFGYVPGYVIEDVAGEGAPVVGVVERQGQALWLVAEDGARYRLAGALARPRIAGPGYKIWALGTVTTGGGERILVARRLGVLAPPWRRAQARDARRTIFAISAGAPTRTGGPQ